MPRLHHRFRAMGTICDVVVDAPDEWVGREALAAGEGEVLRLQARYTRYRDDSITSAINRSAGDDAGIEVDDETAALLDYAAVAWRESGGLFDISSGVLRKAWDFRSQQLPDQAQIDALLPLVGWQRVIWQRPRLVLPQQGMQLDFGGYVKEYAADAAAARCQSVGARHGYVDLGGDIRVIGPQANGDAWRIGIRDPRAPERAIAVVELASGGIATSGDYERCMIVGGRRYSHLLDPRSGWPVDGHASVSVVAPQSLIAGTATTTALLMGGEPGAAWLRALGLPYLLVDQQGKMSGSLTRLPNGGPVGVL